MENKDSEEEFTIKVLEQMAETYLRTANDEEVHKKCKEALQTREQTINTKRNMEIQLTIDLNSEEIAKLQNLCPDAEMGDLISYMVKIVIGQCDTPETYEKISFYKMLGQKINSDFALNAKAKEYMMNKMIENYDGIKDWKDYEKFKQYAIMKFPLENRDPETSCRKEEFYEDDSNRESSMDEFTESAEIDASETCLPTNEFEPSDNVYELPLGKAENETPKETAERIYYNIKYKFKYTFGKTSEELDNHIKGISDCLTEEKRGMTMTLETYSDTVKQDVEKNWKRIDVLPTFIIEQILLLHLSNETARIKNEDEFWEKANHMNRSLSARIESFKFNPESDEREEIFKKYFKDLTSWTNITDEQIDQLIRQIPYRFEHYSRTLKFDSYEEAYEHYTEIFGKKHLEKDEKKIASYKNKLPMDIEEIKKIYYWTGTGWKKYCENEEQYIDAIKEIQNNLDEREEAGLISDDIHIPSGPCPETPKYTNLKIIEANIRMMPKYNDERKMDRINNMFLQYKTKETIIRHLILEISMTREEAEELASFKGSK